MNIEIREYVRTENGLIGKVNKIEPRGSGCRFAGEFLKDEIIQFNDGKNYERRVKRKQVVKHSKNLIDLIEVGDYINGKYVKEINQYKDGKSIIALIGIIDAQDIKTILTKEQHQSNCYTVEAE